MKIEKVFLYLFAALFFFSCTSEIKEIKRGLVKKKELPKTTVVSAKHSIKNNRSYTLFNPNKEVQLEIQKTWLSELESLMPQKQFYKVDPSRDTVILGEAGTAIALASNSLQSETGSTISGLINIQLTEYVKPSQFAAQQLCTRTTDGEMLETVGMLNIEANQNGENLVLKEDEELSVAFPLHS